MSKLNKIDDLKMMVNIAELHYLEGKSQKQIAEMLDMSPNRVSRYIKKSIKNGIVQFTVKNPFNTGIDYIEKMRIKHGLSKVIVVPVTDNDSPETILAKVGQTTAEYLAKNLHSNMSIGLEWGRTSYAVAKALPMLALENLTIVQMMGGSYKSKVSNDQVFLEFSKKLNADLYRIPAPVALNTAEIRNALMSDKNIINTLSRISDLDMMLITVGPAGKNSVMYSEGFVSDEDIENIEARGGVGNICARVYDINGNICYEKLNERIIGVELDTIAKNNNVVLVACGEEKVLPMIGALNGGYCDILITDSQTFQQLSSSYVV